MSIFTDTMVTAIRKYRTMLRKHLPQAQRVNHLHQLDLKNPRLYSNEGMMYRVGYKIIEHLRELDHSKNGYYSYSGVGQFASHLQKFLDKYKLDQDQDRVIHTSQLASRHMVKVAQMMLLENNQNLDEFVAELDECHEMIIQYASKEQIDLYKTSLFNLSIKHEVEKSSNFHHKIQQLLNQLNDEKRSVA